MSNAIKLNRGSIVKDCFMLDVENVFTPKQYAKFRDEYPTITEHLTYEQALALRVMKIGLLGNDKDAITAFVHLNNRAYGLPKADIEIGNKLVQIEPLSEVEVLAIGEHFKENY